MSDTCDHVDRMDPRVVSRRSGVSRCMAQVLLMAQGFRVRDDDAFPEPTTSKPQEAHLEKNLASASAGPRS